jgi:ABC-type nickel/cobalt efflux system permease component RcnA
MTIPKLTLATNAVSIALLVLVAPGNADAHPMGNFSINHYSKLKVSDRSTTILYLVDMAEIPTYQEIRGSGLTATNGDPSIAPYLIKQEQALKQGLLLEIDGQAVPLAAISREATFAEGAGGLPTMKLRFVFRALSAGAGQTHKLSYVDNNFPGRSGWKEIVVSSDGADIVGSSAPDKDRSNELSAYSTDLLNSPPQQLSTLVEFRTALPPPAAIQIPAKEKKLPVAHVQHTEPVVAPAAVRLTAAAGNTAVIHRSNTPRNRFTDLISSQRNLSFWILLTAAFLAAGLGAMHALEPGHGKTLVAAYLVGSRGTAKHAVLLGIVVTAAHTAGVFALGIITLYASRYIVPEQLYPWLGAISGISVSVVGVLVFLRHLTGETGDHSHAPGEEHSHWFSSRPGIEPTKQEGSVSIRQLLTLGISGGIIPCPAALVVLLSAFSLHRIGFGLFLITAFSVGLAAVLVTVGLLMVYTKRFVSTYVRTGGSLVRYLPLLSSGVMVVLGVGIAISAFGSIPMHIVSSVKDSLVPILSVTLLGLFLGMRHSTDSDHIVAVSTLVSRQGSIRSSATIGMLWGLGHTITIFLVGSAIIIFGVVIPPRLGLSMEFSVALMLILLGVLNLTGVLKRVTERFSPPAIAATSPDLPRHLAPNLQKLGLFHKIRPLFIGLVHGLAGSAAVALLVLSTIRNPLWATAYLLVFGFGTMAGMVLMTATISLPLIFAKNRFSKLTGQLTLLSGLASVAFGMFLVFQIGFVDGLFTSHVHWIPR